LHADRRCVTGPGFGFDISYQHQTTPFSALYTVIQLN
jgi:hypothetical protein